MPSRWRRSTPSSSGAPDASGGAFTGAQFLQPSGIIAAGVTAAAPLAAFTSRHDGIASVVGNLPEIALCVVAWWVIILAFVAVALHLVMTIVELHFSILLSAVLFPWGALSHTAFLCELVVSWLTACLVRILVTVAFMSISVPLFTRLRVVLVDGDPEILSVVLLLGAAGIFALLAWIIPNRAAAYCRSWGVPGADRGDTAPRPVAGGPWRRPRRCSRRAARPWQASPGDRSAAGTG